MDGKQKENLAQGFLAGREITPLFLLSLNKRGLTDYNLEAKLFKSSLFAEEIFYLLKIGKYAKKNFLHFHEIREIKMANNAGTHLR